MNRDPDNVPQHEEEVVCPHCLHQNAPSAAFCTACGAPLGMVANIDPIQGIYAEGFGFRSAAEGAPRLIILIGVWLIFLPMAGTAITLLWSVRQPGGLTEGFTSLVLLFVSLGILYRVTRNHLVKSRAARKP